MNDLAATVVTGDSLAAFTLRRVREALAHRDSACVTQVLDIVHEMSQKADRLSVQDLAGLIGRDLTTVAKVMKAANCLGYNPGAVEITTLPEAIAIIGFERIRNLVLSLLLMATAEERTEGHECREVAALALASGLLAQSVMVQTAGINPDQAFVCAALRHYGTLLLCTFLPDEYRQARECQTAPGAGDSGFRSVFGLTPLELGQRILAEAGLSKPTLHSLEVASPTLLRSDRLSELDRLQVTSEFAAKICEAIGNPDGVEQCQAELAKLIKHYVHSIGVTEKDLKGLLETVGQTLGTFGRAHGYQGFSSPLIRRIHWLAESKPRPGDTEGQLEEAETQRAPDPLALGIAEVIRLLGCPMLDYRRILGVVAQAVRAGLRLSSCLIFLPDPATSMFAADLGSGALFDAVRHQPVLNPRARDVFSISLDRGEDSIIQDPSDPKIAPFIPDWFKQAPGHGPFVLLPVRDEAGPFAIVCGVVDPGAKVELTGPRLQQLKALRGHLRPLGAIISPGRAA